MGIGDFLRQKSFRRELQKAEKSKREVKEKARKFAEIDEMKKRLEQARGVKGLSKAEKVSLKKRIDKMEARKKELKKAGVIAGKIALKAGKATLKFIFTKPKPKAKPRKKKTKRGKKKK